MPKAGIEWEETGIQVPFLAVAKWAKGSLFRRKRSSPFFDKQRLDLLLFFGAAAAAADQPSSRGLTPLCLAPLRSAAKRGIPFGP